MNTSPRFCPPLASLAVALAAILSASFAGAQTPAPTTTAVTPAPVAPGVTPAVPRPESPVRRAVRNPNPSAPPDAASSVSPGGSQPAAVSPGGPQPKSVSPGSR